MTKYRRSILTCSLLVNVILLTGTGTTQTARKKADAINLDIKTVLRNAEAQALDSSDLERKRGTLSEIGNMQLEVGDQGGARQTFLKLSAIVQILPQDGEPEFSCSECVEGLGKARSAKDAYDLISKLMQGDIRDSACFSLGKVQAANGDEAGVRRTLALFRDDRNKAELLMSLADYATHKGQKARADLLMEEARRLMDSITDALDKAVSLEELVGHQIEAGQIETALHTADAISRKDQQKQAWVRIAQAQALNNIETARQILDRISDADAKSKGMADVVRTLLEARKVNEALQVAEQLGDREEIAQVLIAIAEGQIEADDKTAATQTLTKAKQQVLQINSHYYVIDPLLKVAEGQARCGQTKEAAQTFEQVLQRIQDIPKPEYRDGPTMQAAIVHCRLGNMSECLALVKTLRAGNQSATFSAMVSEQLALQQYKAALAIAFLGKQVWHPEYTARIFARMYMLGGEAEKAQKQTIFAATPGERANAWLGMAEGLWERKQSEKKPRKHK